ncbi:MAG: RNA methyltransferase [Desulfobulbaceae bacterium]|nr:RNA methyltransferase [Desulfobulbaceae bacterium]
MAFVTKPAQVSIVLVEPQGPLNIGSVCRVMTNFGFNDLRLVNPQADHLSKQARDMAVSAKDMLRHAKLFRSLSDALADCHFCLGTTRRFGKYREDFFEPHEVAGKLATLSSGQHVALVFGREDNGLTTAELDLCHSFVTIATDPALPSMNLAQAVTVCLYELSKENYKTKSFHSHELADGKTLESMYQHMRRTLLDAGYLDPQNPDHILRTFRQMLNRSGLDEREVRILHGLWSRIDWLNSQVAEEE